MIPWADLTWSPIVGCNNGCPYCYARRIATTRLAHLCPKCATFEPHLHEERLEQPWHVRRPAVIFCDSMADWWSPGVDPRWVGKALAVMQDCTGIDSDGEGYADHRFVVLTKRPDRIDQWDADWMARTGVWLGVSITSGADWWRWEALAKLPIEHRFISVEPLLGAVAYQLMEAPWREGWVKPKWVIVGPMSGKGAFPVAPVWQRLLREACDTRHLPLFEKAGLPLQPPIRQMPAELKAVFRKGGLND
jgi:protein gp37